MSIINENIKNLDVFYVENTHRGYLSSFCFRWGENIWKKSQKIIKKKFKNYIDYFLFERYNEDEMTKFDKNR